MASRRRKYESGLRQAHAAQTRTLILEAARELIEKEGNAEALTLPRVAAQAGVSVPTVYRHFKTVPDLLGGFLDWLRPRIGMTAERLLEGTPDDVLALPQENFPRFEEHAVLMRALIDSPAFNRVRLPSVGARAKRAAALFAPVARGLSPKELEAAVGAIYALGTPQTWRWLRDTWGLDEAQALRAAMWGRTVMMDALKKPRKAGQK